MHERFERHSPLVSANDALVLFTKPPLPGRVKTRLIGPAPTGLSAEAAADLHWAFVLDLLERLEERDFTLFVAWALDDAAEPPPIAVPSFRQHGGDLGERLWRGLARVGRSASRVAAVGSDHPGLTLARVHEAFALLEGGADVVLGPAADGGYYLVAVRTERLDRRLFEGISWSTGAVLGQTLERCAELGLAVELLPEATDVDTPRDLARLAATLTAGDAGCPRTRRLLDSWGWLNR